MDIKIIIFDIDGVITDGKKYIDGFGNELKTVLLKDLDTFQLFKKEGYILGCISGEDTAFSRQFIETVGLDFAVLGCKNKIEVLNEKACSYNIAHKNICYIGDGKYDIPVLEKVGLAVCPDDAIDEVKKICDIVLKCRGGEGCLAELHSLLLKLENNAYRNFKSKPGDFLVGKISEHIDVLDAVAHSDFVMNSIQKAIEMIVSSYKNSGHLFLCGNGGSAADAQHLAAEMVGRFCLERQALSAEALTVNTSILTCLANDYNYDMIFARQLEAKAAKGDMLIGITTSGHSSNVLEALKKAEEMGVGTILMTGEIQEYAEILQYTDCLLSVPSQNTPRIQEVHILMGHMICEEVERRMADNN